MKNAKDLAIDSLLMTIMNKTKTFSSAVNSIKKFSKFMGTSLDFKIAQAISR